LHSFSGGEARGTRSARGAKLQAHAAPIKAKLGYTQRVIISLKILSFFSENFSLLHLLLELFQSFHHTLMAPKQRPGKEVATSATTPVSPPSAVGHPIAGRELFPF